MLLRFDAKAVVAQPSEDDLAALAEAGLLSSSVARLQQDPSSEARDALLLLHRLLLVDVPNATH